MTAAFHAVMMLWPSKSKASGSICSVAKMVKIRNMFAGDTCVAAVAAAVEVEAAVAVAAAGLSRASLERVDDREEEEEEEEEEDIVMAVLSAGCLPD